MKSHRLHLILLVGLLLVAWALFLPALASNAGLLLFTPTAWFYLPLVANNAAPVTLGPTVTPSATETITASPTSSPTQTPTSTRTSTRTPTRTPTPICRAAPSCTVTPSHTPTPTLTLTATQTPTETPTPTNTPDCIGDEPVDPALSAFMALSSTVRADGVETADLLVTLVSTCGALMPSQPVTITSSRIGGVDMISPTTGLTNVSGQFFSTVRSSLSSMLDDITMVYTPSVFTAQAGLLTVALLDQPAVRFTCANGIPAGFSSNSDIQYLFINETPEDRSLDRVTLTWPAGAGVALTNIAVFPPSFIIWSGLISTSPAIVNSGWLGTPANRSISASGASLFLSLTFNMDLSTIPGSPNNPFEIQTQWKDEATGRVCTSDFVMILR